MAKDNRYFNRDNYLGKKVLFAVIPLFDGNESATNPKQFQKRELVFYKEYCLLAVRYSNI